MGSQIRVKVRYGLTRRCLSQTLQRNSDTGSCALFKSDTVHIGRLGEKVRHSLMRRCFSQSVHIQTREESQTRAHAPLLSQTVHILTGWRKSDTGLCALAAGICQGSQHHTHCTLPQRGRTIHTDKVRLNVAIRVRLHLGVKLHLAVGIRLHKAAGVRLHKAVGVRLHIAVGSDCGKVIMVIRVILYRIIRLLHIRL